MKTRRFLGISIRLLLWTLLPLGTAILIDLYLVNAADFGRKIGAETAAALGAIYAIFWTDQRRARPLHLRRVA